MTTNEALARRWMASKHWGGWRVGMVDADGRVCLDGGPFAEDDHGNTYSPARLPDLDHPGTCAFLREDLKRAFEQKWRGMDGSSFEVSHGGNRQEWRVEWRNLSNGGGWMLAQLGTGDTEAEALIAALEAAP